MMNSEIATSVLLGQKLTIVVLDNHGFGCITRLQQATGGARFNNLFEDTHHAALPAIDFRAHAESLGAIAEKVDDGRRTGGRARPRHGQRPHHRDRHRHRPLRHHRGRRPLVGRGRAGGLDAAAGARPRARPTRRRSARGGSETRRGHMPIRFGTNPIGWSNDDMPELGGDTPLEQCLTRGEAGRLRGHGARQQVSARAGGAARRRSRRTGWLSSPAGIRPSCCGARRRRRWSACARISTCSRRWAPTCWSSPRPPTRDHAPAAVEAPGAEGEPVGRPRQALDRDGRHDAGRRACASCFHHHMGTVVQAEAEIHAMMAATGPSFHLLLDTGHATWGGADPGRAGAALPRPHQPLPCQGRAQATSWRSADAEDWPLPQGGGRGRLHRARRRQRRFRRAC